MRSKQLVAILAFVCAGMFCVYDLAWAQPNTQSGGVAAFGSESRPSAPAAQNRNDAPDDKLVEIKEHFDYLKIAGLAAIFVAAGLGLYVYGRMHRRAIPKAAAAGLAVVVVAAPMLFWVASYLLLTEGASLCLTEALARGANATPYDDVCRSARESVANLLGMKSAWGWVMGQQILNGVVVPISAGVIQRLMYVSILIGAVLLFFAFIPIVRKGQYTKNKS